MVLSTTTARVNCPITEEGFKLGGFVYGVSEKKSQPGSQAGSNPQHPHADHSVAHLPLRDLISRVTFAVSEMKQKRADIITHLTTTQPRSRKALLCYHHRREQPFSKGLLGGRLSQFVTRPFLRVTHKIIALQSDRCSLSWEGLKKNTNSHFPYPIRSQNKASSKHRM